MSAFGWRWWDLAKDGSLQSVNRDLWPPNEALKAECLFHSIAGGRHPGEKVPAFDCHCGFWAFSDPELASGLPANGFARATKVFGVIEAWGQIIEHDLGFRAEFAIPRAVVVLRGRLHPVYEMQRFSSIPKMLETWDFDDPERQQ